MLKAIITILFIIISSSGFAQNPGGTIGVGIVRERIDSNVLNQIKVINTGQSNIIAFPAEYTQKHYLNALDSGEIRTYFTPDSITLVKMNEALKTQYCDAKRYRAISSCNHLIKLFGKEMGESYIKEKTESKEKELATINKFCSQWKKGLDSIDKQVLAFTSDRYKGKVLFIQLCDFREDPYKLKERAKRQMIDGWHGWFETNIETLYYNIEQNKVSVHGEDF